MLLEARAPGISATSNLTPNRSVSVTDGWPAPGAMMWATSQPVTIVPVPSMPTVALAALRSQQVREAPADLEADDCQHDQRRRFCRRTHFRIPGHARPPRPAIDPRRSRTAGRGARPCAAVPKESTRVEPADNEDRADQHHRQDGHEQHQVATVRQRSQVRHVRILLAPRAYRQSAAVLMLQTPQGWTPASTAGAPTSASVVSSVTVSTQKVGKHECAFERHPLAGQCWPAPREDDR